MNLIIGAGAVGTVLAGYLGRAREPVTLLVRKEELPTFQGTSNLIVDKVHSGAPIKIASPTVSTDIDLENYQRIFICVKQPDLPALLSQLPEVLPDNVELFPCVNGVSIGRNFRDRFPGTAVTPVTIQFNAVLREPMHAEISRQPTIQLQGADSSTFQWFEGCGFIVEKTDEDGAWGRLIANLGHPISALSGAGYRQRLQDPALRECILMAMQEGIAVLQRAGIDFHLPYRVNWPLFEQLLTHSGNAAWWIVKRSGVSANSAPSMLADLDLGRPTEIEQINGEIVRLGAQVRMATPVNQRLVSLIHAAEQDVVKFSPNTLKQQLVAAKNG